MDRAFLIQLTNAVYRLTLFFPKKEPLRYKMREVAVDILAKTDEKDLEILNSFFEVALIQNWVKPADILSLKGEYDSLKDKLAGDKISQEGDEDKSSSSISILGDENKSSSSVSILGDEDKSSSSPSANAREITIFNHNNSERKDKIMTFLKEKDKVQVWQVKEILPEVSKRTLRRDFEDMVGQGLVERVGEKNDTFYKIKTQES